ncbi:hypothetical protein NPIL_399651 [Nephila pilipes]|uniref:Uncharacterized protein n=1 Tax=Nephila pilipes TaxID=299642 RepID=A0A8X6J0P3_NEPPI|nr:hypothetical protein NPIL_399651 [Nephila pilipes]
MKKNFIYERFNGLYSVCYSSNLHLDDNAEPDKWNFKSSRTETRNLINYFNIEMPAHETTSPWTHPVVFFAVHSPFIRVNPSVDPNVLKLGHYYEIIVRLEQSDALFIQTRGWDLMLHCGESERPLRKHAATCSLTFGLSDAFSKRFTDAHRDVLLAHQTTDVAEGCYDHEGRT